MFRFCSTLAIIGYPETSIQVSSATTKLFDDLCEFHTVCASFYSSYNRPTTRLKGKRKHKQREQTQHTHSTQKKDVVGSAVKSKSNPIAMKNREFAKSAENFILDDQYLQPENVV